MQRTQIFTHPHSPYKPRHRQNVRRNPFFVLQGVSQAHPKICPRGGVRLAFGPLYPLPLSQPHRHLRGEPAVPRPCGRWLTKGFIRGVMPVVRSRRWTSYFVNSRKNKNKRQIILSLRNGHNERIVYYAANVDV